MHRWHRCGRGAAVFLVLLLGAGCGGSRDTVPEAVVDADWYRPAPGIDWRDWGVEPFRAADSAGRPVLLYITARRTHDSHRMERDTLADPDVVRLVNERFVPVRVDRDRLPEVDLRHQITAALSFGAGGWPLTLFLTPAGDPIHAVGYLPPDDTPGRPGMRQVLQVVANRFDEQNLAMRQTAAARALLYYEKMPVWESGDLDGGVVDRTAMAVRRDFDPARGGFSRVLQFPDDPALRLALLWAHRSDDPVLADMAVRLLDRLADTGLHDVVGGGFHRRGLDGVGQLPAFEKPLATNAGLLRVYLDAWQASGRPRLRRVAEGIVDFILEELTDPSGGFFAGRSAAVEPAEYAGYYTWTQQEIRSAVSADEARVLLLHFDVGPVGEIASRPDRNVLVAAVPAGEIAAGLGLPVDQVEQLLSSGRDGLLRHRSRRSAPPIDRRRPADANAAAIVALLDAEAVLGRADAGAAAVAAAARLLADQRPDGVLFTHLAGPPQPADEYWLADQAAVATALLLVYERTGGEDFLSAARDALEESVRRFRPAGAGALAALPVGVDRPGLLAQERFPVLDPAESAANAVAAWAFDRLSYLTKEKRYHQEAESILAAFAGTIGSRGSRASQYSIALEQHLRHPIRVIVLGGPDEAATAALTRAAHQVYHPDKMVLTLDPDGQSERVKQIGYPPADRPVAYICTDRSCAPPVFEAERLAATMQAFATRSFADRPLAGIMHP